MIRFDVQGEEQQNARLRRWLGKDMRHEAKHGGRDARSHWPAPQKIALRNNCTKFGSSNSPA
jgi:hypothetical protein